MTSLGATPSATPSARPSAAAAAAEPGSPGRRALATAVALWSAGFAVVHAAWALGWRGGVPAGVAPIAERPVFLAYDVAAGVAMLVAAGVALALGRPGLEAGRRRLLVRLTVVGSVLALLRGVPALAVDAATWSWGGTGPAADAWFVVAGVLGLLLARSARAGRAPGLRP